MKVVFQMSCVAKLIFATAFHWPLNEADKKTTFLQNAHKIQITYVVIHRFLYCGCLPNLNRQQIKKKQRKTKYLHYGEKNANQNAMKQSFKKWIRFYLDQFSQCGGIFDFKFRLFGICCIFLFSSPHHLTRHSIDECARDYTSNFM